MTRFYAAFAVVLAIVCSSVVGAQLLHGDPETTHPPHQARPVAATASLPLAASGADQPGEVIVKVSAWVDGIARAQWIEGVQRGEEERAAAAEAERLRAAEQARSSNVAPSGGGAPPAPAAISDGGCAYADQIRAAWAGTGDEQWAVNTAVRESHCQPGARNPSGASGIFQLMMPLHRAFVAAICGEPADELVFDPGCNITAARAMYDGSGRRPWAF